VAQIGVHAVGKINRRGTLRQLHNGGVGRQHIDAVVERNLLRLRGIPTRPLARSRVRISTFSRPGTRT
jgi:hypothetical protein